MDVHVWERGGEVSASVMAPEGAWRVALRRASGVEVYATLHVVIAGDDAIHLHVHGGDDPGRRLTIRWDQLRAHLGAGPLLQDVRDAVVACRRELDVRHPRRGAAAAHDGYSEVRLRGDASNFEAWTGRLRAGADPDVAAVEVGGTGRPGKSLGRVFQEAWDAEFERELARGR